MDKELLGQIKNLEFALKLVTEVTQRRQSGVLLTFSTVLQRELSIISGRYNKESRKHVIITLEVIESNARKIIDNLNIVIKTEIRFLQYPDQTIKQEAKEIGERYLNNFFHWLPGYENATVEQLLGLVKDDLLKLEQAAEHLDEFRKFVKA